MTTKDNPFSDIDTNSLNSGGVSAKRIQHLGEYDAPLHVLDAAGIDVPHREYNPEDATTFPTTVQCEGSSETVRVSLFQDVKEDMENAFGDLGSAEDEEDDVVWTVSDLSDGTVNLMVVGEWSQRREVDFETFADEYEPVTVETDHGEIPRYGY